MKKKNKIIILISTILVILSLFFLFYVLNNKKDTLTIAEKQWIDNNKTNVIDISVLNDVPAFTYNGNGVISSNIISPNILQEIETLTIQTFNRD